VRRGFPFVFAMLGCGGFAINDGSPATGTDVTNGTDGKGGFGGSGAPVESGAPYRVVFRQADGGLSLYRSATGAVTMLTNAETGDFACTYDGSAIATTRMPSEEIAVLDRDGMTIRTQPGDARAVRPDGLLLVADRPATTLPLFTEGTLDANGTYLVLPTGAQSLFAQSFAPDGTTVLWAHREYEHDTEIVAAPIDLSSRRVIAKVSTGTDVEAPSVSFDGSSIVYLDCSTLCDLDVLDVPTNEVRTLISRGPIATPKFVPDGSAIVFFDSAHDALDELDTSTLAIKTLATPLLDGTVAIPNVCVTSD
jgi:hypothetical protein